MEGGQEGEKWLAPDRPSTLGTAHTALSSGERFLTVPWSHRPQLILRSPHCRSGGSTHPQATSQTQCSSGCLLHPHGIHSALLPKLSSSSLRAYSSLLLHPDPSSMWTRGTFLETSIWWHQAPVTSASPILSCPQRSLGREGWISWPLQHTIPSPHPPETLSLASPPVHLF